MSFEKPTSEGKEKIPAQEILKNVGLETVEELKSAMDVKINNSRTAKEYVEFLKEVFKDVEQEL